MIKPFTLFNMESKTLDKKKEILFLVHKFVQIDEEQCIGCTKCILSCPANAIIGTRNAMHTVLKDTCNGCNLCINNCPINCIKYTQLS